MAETRPRAKPVEMEPTLPHSPSDSPARWRTAALLALAIVLALCVRACRLSAESAWCDEALTLSVLDAPTLVEYWRNAFDVDPMARMVPVYHVVQYGWSRVFGASDEAVRWLSIVLGVACLPPLHGLVRRLIDGRAALLAVYLMALSQVHLYQSQEVRFYALLLFLSLVSMVALQRALDTGRKRWWCAHGVANTLMMWTHAFAPLFFCVQAIYLLLSIKVNRDLAVSPDKRTAPIEPRAPWWSGVRRALWWGLFHAAIGTVFLLWLRWLDFTVARESHAYHLMLITWRDVANNFIVFAGGRPTRENPASYMPGGVSLDLLLAVLFAIALAAIVLSMLRRRTSRTGVALFLLWTLLPFLLLYAMSRIWTNVFFYRYVIYCLPPACALFAAGLLSLPGIHLRRGAVALALAALAYQAVFVPRPLRADYRTAGRVIAADATDATRVLALKEFNGIAVRYNTPLPEERIETYHGFDELCAAAEAHLRDHTPVCAVFYWWDRIDAFEARMRDAVDGTLITRHTFAGMPPLTACELHPPQP